MARYAKFFRPATPWQYADRPQITTLQVWWHPVPSHGWGMSNQLANSRGHCGLALWMTVYIDRCSIAQSNACFLIDASMTDSVLAFAARESPSTQCRLKWLLSDHFKNETAVTDSPYLSCLLVLRAIFHVTAEGLHNFMVWRNSASSDPLTFEHLLPI